MNSAMAFKKLLSVKELAIALNLSSQTIYRRAQAGDIPAIRIGSNYRFDYDCVLAHFSDQNQKRSLKNESTESVAIASQKKRKEKPALWLCD